MSIHISSCELDNSMVLDCVPPDLTVPSLVFSHDEELMQGVQAIQWTSTININRSSSLFFLSPPGLSHPPLGCAQLPFERALDHPTHSRLNMLCSSLLLVPSNISILCFEAALHPWRQEPYHTQHYVAVKAQIPNSWVRIPASILTNCVTVSKSLHLSEPQFPHL